MKDAKCHPRLHHCLLSESKDIAEVYLGKKTGSLSSSAGFMFFSALLHFSFALHEQFFSSQLLDALLFVA